MIWSVSDEGSLRVILEARRSTLTKTPQEMIHDYTSQVDADLAQNGIHLIRDSYRIRLHRDRDLVTIFWNGEVAPDQVEATRAYLATLAESHAGG